MQVTVDNRWVVPYNPFLSLTYGSHINCEMVHSVQAVKYLYKYICKGSGMVTVGFKNEGQSFNEITHYESARFLSIFCIILNHFH